MAARIYAMVNAAMYDAVNGIDRARGKRRARTSALVGPKGAPSSANQEAAAATAAHAVLVAEVPQLMADFDALLAEQLDSLGNGGRVTRGAEWGREVGEEVVRIRFGDGSSPPVSKTYEDENGEFQPGVFRGRFGSAQFADPDYLPFAIHDPDIYVSNGPPLLESLAYAGAYAEVQLLGDGRIVNDEFNEIVRFWRGGRQSARPPGEWIKITGIVAEQEGTTESISDTARLFALQGLAMHDAVLPAWRSKDKYAFWRPFNAIRHGEGVNPYVSGDPEWEQRNSSIGSSPEHTSGQSTFAGAGSTILAGFYCTDFIAFTFTGDDAIAGPRDFGSFSDAAREAGRARILAGIHFEFSNQAGQSAGRGLANEILTESLQRLRRTAGPDPKCPQA